ncbi:glycoside hydrolase family 99-like domain-containing protein [Salinarchaeum sp. Harcht-Bsk1]|uniref:glycoside hydrolase family 99-like domain-containing protein n=1 Tax=Salinarchaeum sp. Harcht-Bsk1 TaxID=1333523 RepID=UPI0006778D22|nr:glycoside hydrolase family 99-like domain-containing protein [Salinarchaeum sp. Harcht-Bsk1]
MDKELPRRVFLTTTVPLGGTLLAGCNQPTDTEEETQTENTTQTDTQTDQPSETPDPLANADFTLSETGIIYGDSVVVGLELENTSEAELNRTLPLTVGGQQLDRAQLTLAPGESTTVELTGTPEKTGTQTVEVGNHHVGTVVVRAAKPDAARAVGAHYYPWYGSPLHDWRDGEWSRESPSTPVLGDYNSADPAVIEQHIDWCRQAGVSWLNVSWWGPNSVHDTRFQEDILGHPRADELSWSILYETTGRLGSDPVALDDDYALERFTNDLQHLAETFFNRDSYKRIDGRPVLYIWVAQNLRGDVESAYQSAVEAAGVEPYLIVDMPVRTSLAGQPMIEVADAVTTYSVYNPNEPTREAFIERAQSTYRSWYRAADYLDVDVIPTAAPGFDDTEITHTQRDNEPVPSMPEIYQQTGQSARHYADGPVLVTSFNEWYEDTQIEPSEQHGTAYLDATAEIIASAEREPPTFEGEVFRLIFERTVPESELNPQVEDGRDLTFMLYQLTIETDTGATVLDADIGTRPEGVEFIVGSSGPEQADSNSWQWLGGSRETVISVPSLPDRGRIDLTGIGATDMAVSLKVGHERLDTTRITDELATQTLRLG